MYSSVQLDKCHVEKELTVGLLRSAHCAPNVSSATFNFIDYCSNILLFLYMLDAFLLPYQHCQSTETGEVCCYFQNSTMHHKHNTQ